MNGTRIHLEFRRDEPLTVRLQRIGKMLLMQSMVSKTMWFWTDGLAVAAHVANDHHIAKATRLTIVISKTYEAPNQESKIENEQEGNIPDR